jgi:hypothetical protein
MHRATAVRRPCVKCRDRFRRRRHSRCSLDLEGHEKLRADGRAIGALGFFQREDFFRQYRVIERIGLKEALRGRILTLQPKRDPVAVEDPRGLGAERRAQTGFGMIHDPVLQDNRTADVAAISGVTLGSQSFTPD